MSITRALLEPSPLSYKPLISRPLEFSLITTTPTFRPTKPLKYSPIKSHLIIPSKTTPSQNPLEGFFNTIFKTLKPITKPATTAILIGVLLTLDFNSAALAASAGRISGNSFSSSRSSSSSSNSRRYSVSRDSCSCFSYSAPYYGGGKVDVKPSSHCSELSEEERAFRLQQLRVLCLLFLFGCFLLVSSILSDRDEGEVDEGEVWTVPEKTSVLKLQVGLLGTGKALQRDLNRIAEVADTSSRKGLSYVLTEASLALIRHPDNRVSAYSSVDVKPSIEDGEKHFNQLSIEERGKFDEETLVNVNNIKRQSTGSRRSNGFNNEYIVITILVAAEGVHKLPPVNGGGDLKEALQKLAAIPTSKLLAVEVLWTPQNENDTLSERELLEDYPLLRPL